MAEAPTPGRYLLYLDLQLDGTVHSLPFVVTAVEADAAASGTSGSHDDAGTDAGTHGDSHSDSPDGDAHTDAH